MIKLNHGWLYEDTGFVCSSVCNFASALVGAGISAAVGGGIGGSIAGAVGSGLVGMVGDQIMGGGSSGSSKGGSSSQSSSSPSSYDDVTQARQLRSASLAKNRQVQQPQDSSTPVGLKDAVSSTSYKSNAFNLEQFHTDWGKKLDGFYSTQGQA